jgi:ribosome-dependent ATPase
VEFVLAKQLPYAALSLVSFASLAALVVAGFQVPLRGSFLGLALGAVPYVFAGTALGLLVSSFTRTQAASALVAVLIAMVPSFQYSGLLSPVSAMRGAAHAFARVFPTTHYLSISVGAFTKGLGPPDLLGDYAALALMGFVFSAASVALLRKQER